MPRGPRPCSPKQLQTKAAQLAARDAAIEKITQELQGGRKSLPELLAVVGGKRPTLVSYMLHMHKQRRTIRPTSEKRGTATLWELGADPTLPTLDEELDRIFAPKRGIAPARQVGMRRDPMVAALFGSARGVAA